MGREYSCLRISKPRLECGGQRGPLSKHIITTYQPRAWPGRTGFTLGLKAGEGVRSLYYFSFHSSTEHSLVDVNKGAV